MESIGQVCPDHPALPGLQLQIAAEMQSSLRPGPHGGPAASTATMSSPMKTAVTKNRPADVARLLDAGEGIDCVQAKLATGFREIWGMAAAHLAAKAGSASVMKLLIERGADINLQDYMGSTALHWAAQKNHADVAELLISCPFCNRDVEDKLSFTALGVAQRQMSADVIRLLDPNAAAGAGGFCDSIVAVSAANSKTALKAVGLNSARLKLQRSLEDKEEVFGTIKRLFDTYVAARPLLHTQAVADPFNWARLGLRHAKVLDALPRRPGGAWGGGLAPAPRRGQLEGGDDAELVRLLSETMLLTNAALGAIAGRALGTAESMVGQAAELASWLGINGIPLSAPTAAEHDAAVVDIARLDSPADLLHSYWENERGRPCHYVAIVRRLGLLAVVIRATQSFDDALTDCDAAEVAFLGGTAHKGLAAAAAFIVGAVMPAVRRAAAECHAGQLQLLVTGHSLGGCASQTTALLLRAMGRQQEAAGEVGRLLRGAICHSFAGTCVASADLQQSAESIEKTVCVVYGADMIPRLNVDSVNT